MMIDMTEILAAVVVVLGAVLTRYAVPWLKARLGASRAEDLSYWAGVAVQAAEELARAGKLAKQDKYTYVVRTLRKQGFSLDAKELQTVINSTVWQLINQFKDESEAAA